MGSNSMPLPTAVVKGAGPSGLGAAIALAQEGFEVTVVEKRPSRPEGKGRQNMVAIRPEALHHLEVLGVLESLQATSTLTPITSAATKNELDGSVFTWPLDSQARYPLPGDPKKADTSYVPPAKLDEQVPSTFVTLGQLEDSLSKVAISMGVRLMYGTTVGLSRSKGSLYTATFVHPSDAGHSSEQKSMTPDLVVCASGKNDTGLQDELGFTKTIGHKLDDSILPAEGSLDLQLGPQREMESQRFCVFGVQSPSAEMGILKHVVRKYGESTVQPVVEIEMRHADASHCLLQLPRGFPHDDADKLEAYVLDRVNSRLGTTFGSTAEMKSKGFIVWGEPLVPVTVETAIAPKFVFGTNLVLVGDAGMSCSPSSGLGADLGLTHDGQAIRALAKAIMHARTLPDDSSAWKAKSDALDVYNREKAKGAVIWSTGSRWFYLSEEEAKKIVDNGKERSVDV